MKGFLLVQPTTWFSLICLSKLNEILVALFSVIDFFLWAHTTSESFVANVIMPATQSHIGKHSLRVLWSLSAGTQQLLLSFDSISTQRQLDNYVQAKWEKEEEYLCSNVRVTSHSNVTLCSCVTLRTITHLVLGVVFSGQPLLGVNDGPELPPLAHHLSHCWLVRLTLFIDGFVASSTVIGTNTSFSEVSRNLLFVP